MYNIISRGLRFWRLWYYGRRVYALSLAQAQAAQEAMDTARRHNYQLTPTRFDPEPFCVGCHKPIPRAPIGAFGVRGRDTFNHKLAADIERELDTTEHICLRCIRTKLGRDLVESDFAPNHPHNFHTAPSMMHGIVRLTPLLVAYANGDDAAEVTLAVYGHSV